MWILEEEANGVELLYQNNFYQSLRGIKLTVDGNNMNEEFINSSFKKIVKDDDQSECCLVVKFENLTSVSWKKILQTTLQYKSELSNRVKFCLFYFDTHLSKTMFNVFLSIYKPVNVVATGNLFEDCEEEMKNLISENSTLMSMLENLDE